MSPAEQEFDFWYAIENTEVVEAPRARLETFGTTMLNYRLLTPLMDEVGKVRVREGRIQALRPEILTPDHFSQSPLEGFHSEGAEEFIRWMRKHQQDIAILRYGFRIRHETIQESIVSDPLEAVLERVKQELTEHPDPLAAIVIGVEEPWEVSLLKLLFEVIRRSAPENVREIRGDPDGSRHDIENAFRAARANRDCIPALAALLRRHGRFEEYEDRFFRLVGR